MEKRNDKSVEAVSEQNLKNQQMDTEPRQCKGVEDLIDRVKNDSLLTDEAKLDTLALLVINFRKENDQVQDEINMVNRQATKQIEAKGAIHALNEFLKRQISLIKEEGELKLEEEKVKTVESVASLHAKILEICRKIKDSAEETEEDKTERIKMEYDFKITLLEHQVAKAQIDKAEVKAGLARERLEITKQLAGERERGLALSETMMLLKHQAELYQEEMIKLQKAGQEKVKTFQLFKTQIDTLNSQMMEVEMQTEEWRDNTETNVNQAKEMYDSGSDQDKEMFRYRKQLESMIKLNKALHEDRASLLEKLKKKDY